MAQPVPFEEVQNRSPVHERGAAREPDWKGTDSRDPVAGAAQTVRATLESEKRSAAADVQDVATALREASRRRHEQGDEALGRLAGSAAHGLERLSGTLRQQDLGRMLRDADGFARKQPVALFGLSVAAGFLAVRLLKTNPHD